METTIFLASIWGPAMLAIGLGMFINRDHYAKIYRELSREPFTLLVFGLAGITVGIVQISIHNVWETLPEMLISLFGWLLLIKGVTSTVMPALAERSGRWIAENTQMLNISGAVLVVIGAYLTWSVYFM